MHCGIDVPFFVISVVNYRDMSCRCIATWRLMERRHPNLVSINAATAAVDDGRDGNRCRIASFSTRRRHQNEASVMRYSSIMLSTANWSDRKLSRRLVSYIRVYSNDGAPVCLLTFQLSTFSHSSCTIESATSATTAMPTACSDLLYVIHRIQVLSQKNNVLCMDN